MQYTYCAVHKLIIIIPSITDLDDQTIYTCGGFCCLLSETVILMFEIYTLQNTCGVTMPSSAAMITSKSGHAVRQIFSV